MAQLKDTVVTGNLQVTGSITSNGIALSDKISKSTVTKVEASTTTTQNYTAGQLVIVGDTLYLITSNIASGGTITPGTNATAYSLADILEMKSNLSQDAHHTFFVKGTQSASTNAFTGNLPDVEALYEGLTIDYWQPYGGTSSAATLNLTLKGGTTTGDIPIYTYSSAQLTNQIGQYYTCRMVYMTNTVNGTSLTGWWLIRTVDANDTAYLLFQLGGWTANSAVYRYQLLFQMDENTLTPLNNANNDTGTSKTILTDVAFDPLGSIFYYSTTTTTNANAVMSGWGYFRNAGLVDMRYSLNYGQTFTANQPCYLKVSLQSNGKVKLASSSPLAFALPSTNDGYLYIYLGRTYNTYQINLNAEHPVYYYDGTTIRQYYNMDTSGGGGGGSIDAYTKTEFHSLTVEKFSTSTTYSLGRLVYYNDNLYMFTVHHYPGAWNSNHVYQINKNMAGIPHFLMSKMTTIYDGDHVTYSPGEFCIYNDGLYQFIKKHTYGTSWNISEVFSTKLGNQITLTSKNIAPYFNEETNYSIGDYAVYKAELYKFTSAHAAGAWNSSHVTQVAVGSELNSKLGDAPSDNGYYVRRNGDWVSLTSLDSVGY